MSMKDVNRKPVRITVEDISKVAVQGVVRALEARTAQRIDLTEDEIGHVSGGYPWPGTTTVGYRTTTVGYLPPPHSFLSRQ